MKPPKRDVTTFIFIMFIVGLIFTICLIALAISFVKRFEHRPSRVTETRLVTKILKIEL